ncbi:hypothetical protein FACS1894188_09030 [Clostridia bacterium]|nr:hypothetical protein FACS1894188_09030 [Clostridia bacterium]
MRQLYVCTKPLPNDYGDTLRPRLIGVLRELKQGISPEKNGEYEFEYTIGGKFKENCLRLVGFPEPKRIYNSHENSCLLSRWLPVSKNKDIFKEILEAFGLTEYDEWEWIIK